MTSRDSRASAVLAVNQRFYDAIEARDFGAMQAVWEQSTRATCIHPQRQILRGWDAVANSWLQILSGPPRHQFILTNASVSIEGDLAWVVLDENLVANDSTTTIAATNLFARHDDEWLMVIHHGSVFHTTEDDHTPST